MCLLDWCDQVRQDTCTGLVLDEASFNVLLDFCVPFRISIIRLISPIRLISKRRNLQNLIVFLIILKTFWWTILWHKGKLFLNCHWRDTMVGCFGLQSCTFTDNPLRGGPKAYLGGPCHTWVVPQVPSMQPLQAGQLRLNFWSIILLLIEFQVKKKWWRTIIILSLLLLY